MDSARHRPHFIMLLTALVTSAAYAQHHDKFRQLDELWPTPNTYRTASGAPGHEYWQQKVDYEIDVALDPARHWITGSERITYQNNSPDTLTYLWIQLDQNNFEPDSKRATTSTMRPMRRNPTIGDGEITFDSLDQILTKPEFEGGHRITSVRSGAGVDLAHTINSTMMRIELSKPLPPSTSTVVSIDWNFPVTEHRIFAARSGREYFEDDDNWLYEIAQWFPRLAVYSDANGWQNKQFITSEFALEFGDYVVRITVPEDFVVASTGVLQNDDAVLTDDQRARLEEARKADAPVFIITPDEAKANESGRMEGTKTWEFKAENVRDFAWATSRKFIWDAQGFELNGHFTLAMSFWPKEGDPLWSQYSTHAVLQALESYGNHLFPCPYPVMISVNGPVGGMEYPMITFNGARPRDDGTYGPYTKYGLISVIIHEVGHTWFPMIVNSDERQWTWMDEGTNTFTQFLAEQEWEDEYPSRRGFPRTLTGYFRDTQKVPVMTDGDSILQLGNNAYGKAAVALNILRETVLGRDLFDYAFKEYANRWKFKKPEPADLFRTMEDASGTDLDWFWRAWFYENESVDIAIEGLTLYDLDTGDPARDKAKDRAERDSEAPELTRLRNADKTKRVDKHPELFDFYDDYDEFAVTPDERKKFDELVEGLTDREREIMETTKYFYAADFANLGGAVMPIILKINYANDSSEWLRIPAEVWRYDNEHVSKLILSDKEIESLELDPYQETGDINTQNNRFPRVVEEKRFKVVPRKDFPKNPMQKLQEQSEKEDDPAEETPANNEAS